jgi:beta-glucanase (GH16 family)
MGKNTKIMALGLMAVLCLVVVIALGKGMIMDRNGIAQQRDEDEQQFSLIWQENFNGNSLDTTKWSKLPRYPWQPFWYMSSHESLFRVGRGRLRLYARQNKGLAPNDTAKILCGGVSTCNKFEFVYGKVEVRARIFGVQGSWPAIWTLASDPKVSYGGKRYAEIDLMESINRDRTAHQTIHNYAVDIKKVFKHDDYHVEVPINYRRYNVYGVEILPDRIVMSVNGRTTLVYHRQKGIEGQFPYGQSQYLMLDMQFGGTRWVGRAIKEQLPAFMDVDWVKFYKYNSRR